MNKLTTFLKEVRQELGTITWPKRPDITEGTSVVITMSVITAIFLMIVDIIFKNLITNTLFS